MIEEKYTTYNYWTGFRAVINGVSFNIIGFFTSSMQIALPNGKFAIISKKLPEKITS